MARPKKGEELGATASITMRVPVALREACEGEAKRAGLVWTVMVRTLLEEALAARARRVKRITGA